MRSKVLMLWGSILTAVSSNAAGSQTTKARPSTILSDYGSRPTYSHIPANIVAQVSEEKVNMGPKLNSGQQSIRFGSDEQNGKVTFSDDNGEPVKFLSMDEFEDEILLAFCNDDSVEITFKDEVEFHAIMKDWSFINAHEDNHVMLITTSQQCDKGLNAANNLQPWIVSGAQFDDETKNVRLSASFVDFKALPFRAHIEASSKGRRLPVTTARKREENTTSDDFQNSGNIHFDIAMPDVGISLNSNGGIISSAAGAIPDATIGCHNCSLHCGLDFDIDVHVDLKSPTKLSGGMTLKAHDVGANVSALLSINSALENVINIEQPIFGYVPSGLGFSFGKLIDIGPTMILLFRLSVGYNKIPVAFETGFDVYLDPDAEFKLDFGDPTKSDASNWRPKFKAANPLISDGGISLYAQVGPVFQFIMSGSVLSVGAQAGFEILGGMTQFRFDQHEDVDTCNVQRSARAESNPKTHERPEDIQDTTEAHENVPGQKFLKYDFGIENEIKAFADAHAFGGKVAASHTLASTSIQLSTSCGKKTTEPLETNEIIYTSSLSTFEATMVLETALEGIETAASKVSELGSSVVSVATDEAKGEVDAMETVGKDVGNAVKCLFLC